MPRKVPSSSDHHVKLASRVSSCGVVMTTPCSYCESSQSECQIDISSGRCSECISKCRNCDLVVLDKDCASLSISLNHCSSMYLVIHSLSSSSSMLESGLI